MENKDIFKILGRKKSLFNEDLLNLEEELNSEINQSSFLIIGAAGSIGKAVTTEIFKRNPKVIHVVDINENNLVELVRTLRSTRGYIKGDFKSYVLDIGSSYFKYFIESQGPYDYVLNLSALKHVRSEKDIFSLMRLIKVNILNTISSIEIVSAFSAKKYFCVSTDKAANPVNMMGASKRIMEAFLKTLSKKIDISSSRFANVAFSDGSLLHGFEQRYKYNQPISIPTDVERYFITPQESGELCMLSAIFGKNNEIFFPKTKKDFKLSSFYNILENYLDHRGYVIHPCENEEESRLSAKKLIKQKKWPVHLFKTDTTGEKSFEEFYEEKEECNFSKFLTIGIINNLLYLSEDTLNAFLEEIDSLKTNNSWTKEDLVSLFENTLPNFKHFEEGKNLDQKM
jgi:FlaA1/EpsC-like NDP-sugar epimerase